MSCVRDITSHLTPKFNQKAIPNLVNCMLNG
jgi:hypothetical protein